MADRKISDLTALTTPASGDYLPIVDISETAAASKNKRVTIQSLFQGIPVNVGIGTSSPGANSALEVAGNQKYLSVIANAGGGGSVNPSNSGGLHFSWNRSNGDGESNIIYGTGGGSAPNLQFASWDGTTYTERMRIDSSGRVGIGTASPTTLLDVNADTVRVRTARTPASATATGTTGEICWDANYIYVCTATNTWKRTALSTW